LRQLEPQNTAVERECPVKISNLKMDVADPGTRVDRLERSRLARWGLSYLLGHTDYVKPPTSPA
jgi:hypothetical protein